MDSTRIGSVLLTLALALPLAAGAVDLAPGAPERYTVKRGDTLWDIAGHYLREPWHWPKIWRANPQVRDPDRIYPGDVLTLEYVDGKPVVRAHRVQQARRPGVVKLSPGVRETPIERAIPLIPVDAIGPFITESRVLEFDDLTSAPYVLAAGREHLVGTAGHAVFARRLADTSVERFGIYRQGPEYRSPGTEEVLGYQAIHVGNAVLEEAGDPATLTVTRSTREVQPGDRLLPLEDDVLREPFLPRAPDQELTGTIISVVDGVSQVGLHQAVVIDRGTRDGLQPGHVLAVYQKGEVVTDQFVPMHRVPDLDNPEDAAKFTTPLDIFSATIANAMGGHPEVELPARRAGVVMVVRPFERVSYALVMEATGAMHVSDTVATP